MGTCSSPCSHASHSARTNQKCVCARDTYRGTSVASSQGLSCGQCSSTAWHAVQCSALPCRRSAESGMQPCTTGLRSAGSFGGSPESICNSCNSDDDVTVTVVCSLAGCTLGWGAAACRCSTIVTYGPSTTTAGGVPCSAAGVWWSKLQDGRLQHTQAARPHETPWWWMMHFE